MARKDHHSQNAITLVAKPRVRFSPVTFWPTSVFADAPDVSDDAEDFGASIEVLLESIEFLKSSLDRVNLLVGGRKKELIRAIKSCNDRLAGFKKILENIEAPYRSDFLKSANGLILREELFVADGAAEAILIYSLQQIDKESRLNFLFDMWISPAIKTAVKDYQFQFADIILELNLADAIRFIKSIKYFISFSGENKSKFLDNFAKLPEKYKQAILAVKDVGDMLSNFNTFPEFCMLLKYSNESRQLELFNELGSSKLNGLVKNKQSFLKILRSCKLVSVLVLLHWLGAEKLSSFRLNLTDISEESSKSNTALVQSVVLQPGFDPLRYKKSYQEVCNFGWAGPYFFCRSLFAKSLFSENITKEMISDYLLKGASVYAKKNLGRQQKVNASVMAFFHYCLHSTQTLEFMINQLNSFSEGLNSARQVYLKVLVVFFNKFEQFIYALSEINANLVGPLLSFFTDDQLITLVDTAEKFIAATDIVKDAANRKIISEKIGKELQPEAKELVFSTLA
ncbi:MAG: hypothetical protein K0U12_05885 [Gammaproteobacteria bacterium]|nr:hypothetical protein [Gammaproteobacteria bacterium]